MRPERLFEILAVAERLKCNTRHSWTSTGRRESVAEHSWRLVLMAFLRQRLLKIFQIAHRADLPSFLLHLSLLFTHTCPVTEFAVASHLNTANSCCHHVFLRHFRFQKCLPVYSNLCLLLACLCLPAELHPDIQINRCRQNQRRRP